MKQCLSCGGTYDEVQDGVKYFHVCPLFTHDDKGNLVDIKNRRNENIVGSVTIKGDEVIDTRKIISEGLGVIDVDPNIDKVT